MLSKVNKYRQKIQKATKRIMLFPYVYKKEKKSTVILECDIKLPSSYAFRSSQQIEKNISTTHQITHQSSQQYPTSLNNKWPKSCIGLVLCQHHQNNQTYYVYGTAILIHEKIVLTSAQNVYCRRLNRQYTNIRFIVGVCGDKCSGIYDVMRVHFQNEYTMQMYDNYNFAVLQLYNDLSISCGYIGWKTLENIKEDEKYTVYEYINVNEQGFFNLRQITKHEKQQKHMEPCLRNGVLVQGNKDKFSIVGLQQSEKTYILSEKISNKINQWTEKTYIGLDRNNFDAYGCKYLIKANWTDLTAINLYDNKIGAQGCKYLSQADWINLTQINLAYNKIGGQGCKYLSQANWSQLTTINLYDNNIDAQGCKYLSQANWIHLTTISLSWNNIDAQGCKYLSQANWIHLTTISLSWNNIDAQGCKYLSQANWTHLTTINLNGNYFDAQGCKYLTQSNWTHLTAINLSDNKIDTQGCKYLSQTNWIHLIAINLPGNNINNIIIYQLLLQQAYPKTKIYLQ